LGDLDIPHVAVSVNDSRNLDSVVHCPKEYDVIPDGEGATTWNSEAFSQLNHFGLSRKSRAHVAYLLNPPTCRFWFVACDGFRYAYQVVIGILRVVDSRH